MVRAVILMISLSAFFAILSTSAKADCAYVRARLNASAAAFTKAETSGFSTRLQLIDNTDRPMREADSESGSGTSCEELEPVSYHLVLLAWRGLLLASSESQLEPYIRGAECRKYLHLWSVDEVAQANHILKSVAQTQQELLESGGAVPKAAVSHVQNLVGILARRYRVGLPSDGDVDAAKALSDRTDQAVETQRATMTAPCGATDSNVVPKAIVIMLFGD